MFIYNNNAFGPTSQIWFDFFPHIVITCHGGKSAREIILASLHEMQPSHRGATCQCSPSAGPKPG